MRYALFLRGINVGGIKVPMADLQDCLLHLNLSNIKTFLQTGNVLFDSELSPATLKTDIANALTERFKYQAFVLLFTFTDLVSIIKDVPFDVEQGYHRYVVFCDSQQIMTELCSPRIIYITESIIAGEEVVYWNVPIGQSTKTSFAKLLAKPKYKSTTTTRNINTLLKML